ncbi:MAG: NAD(P)H-dependent oxidoreductase [Nitrospirae bacterium]|nr:NAD(P)H-dependent oxidoreductase [Nitrospirota bacterium]
MKKTLVIVAHPSVNQKSIANKIIVERISTIEQVKIKDLYKEYPSFKFDLEVEQNDLINAESIIFQFPFYWYSVPGILKEWLDQVFTYGFAYGSTGDKLKGKQFLVSTTVGGPAESYKEGGYNNFTINELLKPLQQTANLSGMKYNPPIISHNMIYIPDVYNKKEEVEQRAREHAEELVTYIGGI